jgi:DNA polymerase-4
LARAVLFAEVPDFYAAVERRDAPASDTRPVIVGGDPRRRGLVQAATGDARSTGVEPGMPMLEALRLCPKARAVRTDMPRYNEISRRLHACLRRGYERLEPFGRGAAYFDLTRASDSPEKIGERMREAVRDGLGLPLRVGIASGKFLARLAAEECGDTSGEGGLRRIRSGEEADFLRPLSASRIEGVGEKAAARLAEMGATTIGGVVELGRERLEEAFGNHGLRIYTYATGEDEGRVRAARHPQSLSREVSVRAEGLDWVALGDPLQDLARHLEEELRLQGLCASRVVLKLRFADQVTTTRSRTLATPCHTAGSIQEAAADLLGRIEAGSRPLRGIGIQLGKLAPAAEAGRQLDLFPPRR